jgi:hypothetical protein
MPDIPFIILPLFFVVAFVYSSVGHGGASGYLAVLALFGIAAPGIVPLVLVLNVLVASTGWWQYSRGGHFAPALLAPFALTSIPAAFVGGMLHVHEAVFSLVLGIALVLSALRLSVMQEVRATVRSGAPRLVWGLGLPLGAILGLLSGMIGIGGGVFLSPLLLFLRWADAKRTAAVSSAFIVLNSLSGLAGQLTKTAIDLGAAVPLLLAVGAGGYLGARTGAVKLAPRVLQSVLAVVLLLAGAKLVMKAW